MKWKEIKNLKEEHFKRLIGVKRKTFDEMVKILEKESNKFHHKQLGKKRGPKPKLGKEDNILVMLMYYREYRTFFHTGHSFGISESQCWRIVTYTEKILLKDKMFHIPGKKRLLSENIFEVVLIDATETPIERPKKNKESIIQVKRKNTH